MFQRILIANRGEIAVRIARACREMGIESVAVFSDADGSAMHVRAADRSLAIGPAPARESYLDVNAILEAARRSGADAIHPGYGFLSERAELPEACAAAGIAFIGPPAAVIRLLGDKLASKRLAREAGVPVVPGSGEGSADPAALVQQAKKIPYPILVKAAAGGGGKGMRVVREPSGLEAALEAAAREATAAFGDGRVFLERYVESPRHVEVQVIADTHGNVVALGERECSVQRRHQKVLEESPSPALTPAQRAALLEAGVKAARAANYVNAGTVEFLLAPDGEFYFLEVNTRLQVEHPVTEMVTGLDLVQLQIQVTAGAALPFSQADIRPRGHAIEVRLYAEDPAHGYLPTIGRIEALALPEGPGVRNDSGVGAGDEIGIHYDPMLAKLIVHAEDRPRALARMSRALGECAVSGLVTNLEFLRWLLRQPDVLEGRATTRFLEEHPYSAARGGVPPEPWVDAAALLLGGAGGGPQIAWRPGGQDVPVRFVVAGEEHQRTLSRNTPGLWTVSEPGGAARQWSLDREGDHYRIAPVGGDALEARVTRQGSAVRLAAAGFEGLAAWAPPLTEGDAHARHHGPASLTAPMPGSIIRLDVKQGDAVKEGQRLLVLEAMKMEHTLSAPGDGRIRRLPYKQGDVVPLGAVLVEMEE